VRYEMWDVKCEETRSQPLTCDFVSIELRISPVSQTSSKRCLTFLSPPRLKVTILSGSETNHPSTPYIRATVSSIISRAAPVRSSFSIAFMSSGEGMGRVFSSKAETATLPLIQRNVMSRALVFRMAVMTWGKMDGLPADGLIMLRWFSTTTPSYFLIKSSGKIAAINRFFCSLAVVRWTSTQGSLVTRYCCPEFTWKNGLWFLRTALKLDFPSTVTDSAQIKG
jgi:hypothetical protein